MKDNFSKQAGLYSKYRPDYPPDLFEFVLGHVSRKEAAWDCATGNGQTAKALSPFFDQVFATDISQQQLDHAMQGDNIHYSLQPAEKTGFAANQFDLITVSQALHWFHFENFYREVRRVIRPGGVFAAWSYSLFSISPAGDKIIHHFYTDIIGSFWDVERKLVDEHYTTIPFPFHEINAPAFTMEYWWTIDQVRGYLDTWSAVQKFIAFQGFNPVDDLMVRLAPEIGPGTRVTFPLHMRIGIAEK